MWFFISLVVFKYVPHPPQLLVVLPFHVILYFIWHFQFFSTSATINLYLFVICMPRFFPSTRVESISRAGDELPHQQCHRGHEFSFDKQVENWSLYSSIHDHWPGCVLTTRLSTEFLQSFKKKWRQPEPGISAQLLMHMAAFNVILYFISHLQHFSTSSTIDLHVIPQFIYNLRHFSTCTTIKC